ncbi:uncharacterized protein LOC112164137 [Rosa chinensis]|uniref:uncharacterized protein LOC112164137 n=1 Tax=Rosa chinensis TaxID=74649 RepID=UPI000D097C67|nr:uncharacterized protein LOC112164137 [Rosa chinensis]
MATRSWSDLFPTSRVTHLKPSKSDHLPILVEVRSTIPRKRRRKRRFRFEEHWLHEAECANVVKDGWESVTGNDPFQTICMRIEQTRKALWVWSDQKFGHLKAEIERIRAKLAVFYDKSLSAYPEEERLELETKLNDLLYHEHNYWQQRSRVMWLTDGDLNTRFFHHRASNRKKRNAISGLFNNDGVWCTEDSDLENIVLDYFGTLFSTSSPKNMDLFTNLFPQVVTGEMNSELVREFGEEEILQALNQMHPLKAPGPDGFSPIFYQRYWSVVGRDVIAAVRCFMNSEDFLREVNGTYVTLIPKVKEVENMQQLRPISLCNVIYKLGSKVLANRLKPLLQDIIAPTQSAFVPGRQISDNSLLAFELSHFLKRRTGGSHGYGALKLDMSKAYDRVEWEFIEAVMRSMGFDQIWINWIMGCVTTVSYSFLLNGEPRGHLIPTRGLRQGDSISPYLFLLCAEGLSRMLSYEEEQHRLHGIAIAMGAPSINHLFFADDSFVFMKAEREECARVKEILKWYEDASGQQVNFQKSKISFSKNVDIGCQEELAEVFGVERVDKHDKYLGLPTKVSYSKIEAFQFIMEKTKNKMKNWKDKTLSVAGKEVMIKSVVQSVPTYVMSCFELPKHLCQEMHRCMAEFWWGDSEKGRKIHWLAWDKMCVPKEEGGLGFRNMEYFNQALLAKQGWRILRHPDSLLGKTLKAKYFPNNDFIHASVNQGDSYTWRSLMKGKVLLEKGLRFQVGLGTRISVWFDPWIPRPYSFRPYSTVMEGLEDLTVADLIDPDSKDWMVDWLEELFFADEVDLIRKIPLSLRNPEDRLIWHFDKRGLYSVKSGYHVARCVASLSSHVSTSNSQGDKDLWRRVWHARVQPKVRNFVWRLVKNIVPTKVNLGRRVNLDERICPFCRCESETTLHVFMECNVIACMWLFSSLGLRAKNHTTNSVKEWVLDMLDVLNKSQVDIFFMLLWAIWSERNKLVWNGGTFNPMHTVTWSMHLLSEYQRCHPEKSTHKSPRGAAAKWMFPPRGRLKINVDGAYKSNEGCGGIGVVVRDEMGIFRGARSRKIPYMYSAFHGEAEACRAGLLMALHHSWKQVELEIDCAILATALNQQMEDNSEVSRILDDCKNYLHGFDWIRVRHIYREANSVANRLAHFASLDHVVDLCLDEAPVFIQDVLYEDNCNATMLARGSAWGFICGFRMGFRLEFQKVERSRSSSPSTSSSSHYLSKCLLRGTVVLQVLYSHTRFPNSNNIVFGKEKSIELVIIGEDGGLYSLYISEAYWSNSFFNAKIGVSDKRLISILKIT